VKEHKEAFDKKWSVDKEKQDVEIKENNFR